MEFVGVKNIFDLIFPDEALLGILKREALLVDRIAVLDFDAVLKEKRKDTLLADYRDELIWLYESGFLFKPTDIFRQQYPILDPLFDEMVHHVIHIDIELRELSYRSSRQKRKHRFIERGVVSSQFRTRLTAIYLREKENLDACSLFSHECHPQMIKYKPSSPTRDTLTIVIRALPIPSETTPWEHIAEYRSDPDSKSKVLGLRHWMNEVSRHNLPPIELEQKLEFLIDDYERHMKLHKMKTHKGPLETVVVSTAELLENIIKLKWGEAAKKLFSFKQRQISLLESELSVPGKEVAYILDAREAFPR